jgi:hypothetical protein
VTVTVLGVPIHEFDVAGTDLLLFIEAFVFAFLLLRQQNNHPRLRLLAAALFGWMGMSSLLGAVFHAFFPDKTGTSAGHLIWMLTGISIAVTASVVWYINAMFTRYRLLANVLPALVPVYFIAFVYVLFFVDFRFRTMISFYAPAVVVLAVIAVRTYLQSRSRDWLYLMLGTGLSFVAAAVQTLKVGLHPQYFNFNALYHLIQGVALAFLFLAFRLMLQREVRVS